MNTREFELLVFDWDGTLMDSEARIVACLEQAVRTVGAEPRARQALRNVIGLGLTQAIQRLYPQGDEAFIAAFTAAYREYFLFQDRTPSELFAGSRRVVEGLAAQGYLLAVATGKSRRGLERELAETGLEPLFHVTRCADETFSKPHPRMLEEIMTDLDTAPARTLMIGDSEYDMMMANNAGTASLAVSYGVHDLDRLMQHGPKGHVNAIDELPAWLRARAERVSPA